MIRTVLGLILISSWALAQNLPEPKTEYVKPGMTAEVYSKEGVLLTTLLENTKIQPIMLNSNGDVYEPDLGQRPYYTKDGAIAYGYWYMEELGIISIYNLTTRVPVLPKKVITPDTNEYLVNPPDPITSYMTSDLPNDVLGMVQLFHETTCNNLRISNSTRVDLINKWEQFISVIETHGNYHYRLALYAVKVDLASRTVQYESHANWSENDKGQCEWDIIALTLINRTTACSGSTKYEHYGCETGGDVVGISTAPKQYHIWRDNSANSTFIGSCFLRSDLKEGEYLNLSRSLGNKYRNRVIAYENIIVRTEEILSTRNEFMTFKFEVLSYDGKTNLSFWEKERAILGLRHYYHPQAMGQCYPDKYKSTRWVNSTYIKHKYTDASGIEQTNYSLMRRRRIIPQNEIGNFWTFLAAEVFSNKDPSKEMTYEWNTKIYGDGLISNYMAFLVPNDSFKCTYQGMLPECSEGQTSPNHTYKKMKHSWFDPIVGGKSIAIRCKIPESCTGTDCPGFNGRCDPDMMIVTEMD